MTAGCELSRHVLATRPTFPALPVDIVLVSKRKKG